MSDSKPTKTNSYLKYSGMAFEMVALMGLGYFIGSKLDARFGMKQPIWTMVLMLVFFGGFIYKLYRSLNQK
jgi:F0F1-type ATP synthase assembly protein I